MQNRHCIKYTRSTILPLYERIRVSKNPYSRIFYAMTNSRNLIAVTSPVPVVRLKVPDKSIPRVLQADRN